MWVFDFTAQTWAWISGSNSISSAGAYGQLGVFSRSYSPCARLYHTTEINPQTNQLVSFGGSAYNSAAAAQSTYTLDINLI